ncbi:MAG: glycosyltransferase family 39 protein [Chthoniobacterales bacterium]|nr:glycosyltransferase family 39 protein [Chthoniobacterales bacterium]
MRRQQGASGGNVAPRFAPIALGKAKHPGGWALALLTVIGAVAVGARLILIDQPFVDHWSWRQSDVAAIARNFFASGFHFAYPQIDWAGDSPGYVGTEFPILPFAAAICYKLTGVHEWIGRSQAIVFFALSLPFFFLLARETFGNAAAVWATFFFSFAPLNVFAGRSFMPDVPSLSLAIVGLYLFLRWRLDERATWLCPAAVAISVSFLIKITSIVVAAPLLYLAAAPGDDVVGRDVGAAKDRGRRRRLQLALFALIALLPSALWYWHAWQISRKFYPHHFFGAGGVRIETLSWYWEIAQKTATLSLTPVLTGLAAIGFLVARRGKYGGLFDAWVVAMVLFVGVVGYGNRHVWYQLPLVPVVAAFAGAGCAFIGSKMGSRVARVGLSLGLAGVFLVVSFSMVRLFYEATAAPLYAAGLELNRITAPSDLIIAADGGNPAIFYYAQRKGWHFLEINGIYNGNPRDSREAIEDLEKLRRRGGTHLVFTRNTFWWLVSYPELTQHLSESAKLIAATPDFIIYRLNPMPR